MNHAIPPLPTPPHPTPHTHAHDECIPVRPTASSPTPHQLPPEEHSLLLWGRRWLATEPGSSSPCHRQAPKGSHPTVARQTRSRDTKVHYNGCMLVNFTLHHKINRLIVMNTQKKRHSFDVNSPIDFECFVAKVVHVDQEWLHALFLHFLDIC